MCRLHLAQSAYVSNFSVLTASVVLVMTLTESHGHKRVCVYYYIATDCLRTIPLHYIPDLLSSAPKYARENLLRN